jgi:hypothetical protein
LTEKGNGVNWGVESFAKVGASFYKGRWRGEGPGVPSMAGDEWSLMPPGLKVPVTGRRSERRQLMGGMKEGPGVARCGHGGDARPAGGGDCLLGSTKKKG